MEYRVLFTNGKSVLIEADSFHITGSTSGEWLDFKDENEDEVASFRSDYIIGWCASDNLESEVED